VMLTALAVLQHNDQKLPEYRVELYESVLGWLAAARDAKDGRPTAEIEIRRGARRNEYVVVQLCTDVKGASQGTATTMWVFIVPGMRSAIQCMGPTWKYRSAPNNKPGRAFW
jgi:hypothetical protein